MINKVDAIDGTLMLFGLTLSVQDIQATLSIVIIVIDILWLLGKFLIKFIRYCKDGELTDEELDDLFKTKEEIKNLSEKIKEDNKDE